MKCEQNDKKHLSPRQIVNRYCKGEYVDESIDDISSAISSCGKIFDNIAVAFPTTIVEMLVKNISVVKNLYERQVAGKPIEDINIPDYPQLKDFMMDLAYPPLWESMCKNEESNKFWNILDDKGFNRKYTLDVQCSKLKVVDCVAMLYREAVEEVGLSYSTFTLVLDFMLK